ncbi:MAG: type II toxin-antitoxin system RelE/ParE family toxin [Desulfovibrio sp.]|nr:type II toxin-antitoxin system RelE/ParE family toxin [Desulfovibrio sp.]
MRGFKSKIFSRWVRRESVADKVLLETLERIKNGLIDVNLAPGEYK